MLVPTNECHSTHISENIVLVGLMGAGKTSVGKLLAKRLNKTFYDCDQEIERVTGVKIATIFEIEGEAGFRLRESRVLEDLLKHENILLATGGGAVLSRTNRDLLAARGIVVYLRASAKLLLRRTRHDRNRPLLQVPNPQAKIESLIAERDALYREVADIVVDTGSQSLGALAAHIHDCIAKLQSPRNEFQPANSGTR